MRWIIYDKRTVLINNKVDNARNGLGTSCRNNMTTERHSLLLLYFHWPQLFVTKTTIFTASWEMPGRFSCMYHCRGPVLSHSNGHQDLTITQTPCQDLPKLSNQLFLIVLFISLFVSLTDKSQIVVPCDTLVSDYVNTTILASQALGTVYSRELNLQLLNDMHDGSNWTTRPLYLTTPSSSFDCYNARRRALHSTIQCAGPTETLPLRRHMEISYWATANILQNRLWYQVFYFYTVPWTNFKLELGVFRSQLLLPMK